MRAQTNVVFILAGIILIGFSMFAMLGFIMQSVGFMSDKSIEDMCRSSIETRTLTSAQLTDKNTFSFGGITCRKQDLQFSPSAIYQDVWFSNILYTEDEQREGQKESIMRKFADSMVSCKYMFADNRHEDVFSGLGSEFWEIFGFDEDKPKCFTCYSIAVKDFDHTISAEEFHTFLSTEEMSTGVTYLEYIQGGGNLGGDGTYLVATDIVNDGLYGISYLGRNSDGGIPVDIMEVAETGLNYGVAGAAIGTVAGLVCLATAPVCVGVSSVVIGAAGGAMATGLVAGTIEYNSQVEATYLYGSEGVLKTREYGYFIIDQMETIQHVGCKEK